MSEARSIHIVTRADGAVEHVGEWPAFVKFSTELLADVGSLGQLARGVLSLDGDDLTVACVNGSATYHLGPALAGVRAGTLFRTW